MEGDTFDVDRSFDFTPNEIVMLSVASALLDDPIALAGVGIERFTERGEIAPAALTARIRAYADELCAEIEAGSSRG